MEQFKSKGLTRDDLREAMLSIAALRQIGTPDHLDPAWMSAAYRHVTS